jgi:hypothetical protein
MFKMYKFLGAGLLLIIGFAVESMQYLWWLSA